jgi:hypothetical protein
MCLDILQFYGKTTTKNYISSNQRLTLKNLQTKVLHLKWTPLLRQEYFQWKKFHFLHYAQLKKETFITSLLLLNTEQLLSECIPFMEELATLMYNFTLLVGPYDLILVHMHDVPLGV